jgi:hypothetical protein
VRTAAANVLTRHADVTVAADGAAETDCTQTVKAGQLPTTSCERLRKQIKIKVHASRAVK